MLRRTNSDVLNSDPTATLILNVAQIALWTIEIFRYNYPLGTDTACRHCFTISSLSLRHGIVDHRTKMR